MKRTSTKKFLSVLLSVLMLVGICVPAFAAYPTTLFKSPIANTSKTLDEARALIKASATYGTLDSTAEGKVKQEVAASIISTYTDFVPKTSTSQTQMDLYTVFSAMYHLNGTKYGYAAERFLNGSTKTKTGFGQYRFLYNIVEHFKAMGENPDENLPKIKDYAINEETFTIDFLKSCAKVAGDVINEQKAGSVGEAFSELMGTWYNSSTDCEVIQVANSKAETGFKSYKSGRLSTKPGVAARIYIGDIIEQLSAHQPGIIKYDFSIMSVKEDGTPILPDPRVIDMIENGTYTIPNSSAIPGFSKNTSGAPIYTIGKAYAIGDASVKELPWAEDNTYNTVDGKLIVKNKGGAVVATFDAEKDAVNDSLYHIKVFANYQTNFTATISGYSSSGVETTQTENAIPYGLKGKDLGNKVVSPYFANRPGYDYNGADIDNDGTADFDVSGNPISEAGNNFYVKGNIEVKSVYTANPIATFYQEDGKTVIIAKPVSYGTLIGKSSDASSGVEAPTKEGFEFSHWAILGATTDASNIKITRDVSLVPVYKSTAPDPLLEALNPIIEAVKNGADAKAIVKLLPPVFKALATGGYGDFIKKIIENQLPEGGFKPNGGNTIPNDVVEKLKAFFGKLSPNDGGFTAPDIAQMLSALPQVASRLSKAFGSLFSALRTSIENAFSGLGKGGAGNGNLLSKITGLLGGAKLPDIAGGLGGLGGGLGGIVDKVKGLFGMGGGASSGSNSKTGSNMARKSSSDKSFKNTKTGDVSLYALSAVAVVAGVAVVLTKKKKNDD